METKVIFVSCVIIFLNSGLFAQNNLQPTGRSLADLNPWLSWSLCSPSELCEKKRVRSCIHQPNPYLTCRENSFEEKYRNCESCREGFWYLKNLGKCLGEGCGGKKQEVIEGCSNTFQNRINCERITTKFCNLTKTCDGSWGTWIPVSKCLGTSDIRFQVRIRRCIKDERPGYACLRSNSIFTQEGLTHCGTASSTRSSRTTTTTVSMTTLTATTLNQSKRMSSAEKLPATQVYSWWDYKSFVLIIQTIVIFVLIVLLLYCFLWKKRKIRRNKSIPSIVVQPSQTIPPVQYTDVLLRNDTENFEISESDKMLPNQRLSCPRFQRPLPDRPKSQRPKKPPRRKRTSMNPAILPHYSPYSFADSLSTTIPKSLNFSHSAPASPMQNFRKANFHLNESIEKIDSKSLYLSPVN